jgi:hypothetical protein
VVVREETRAGDTPPARPTAEYFSPADTLKKLAAGTEAGRPTEPNKTPPAKHEPPKLADQVAQKDTKKGLEKAKEESSPDDVKAQSVKRVILRSGEIDFEVDSFDTAVEAITALVTKTKGAFIATINSDKLPNGKVRGSVVVRVPPENLDALVLGLRKDLGKTGELKGQRIGSQDVTKQYTDLESRLRAARTMEERLIGIIKNGKGEVKDLVLAEKELGVWRTKIEETEGELRYYANLAALSTLTINLTEKEIRVAAAVKETERVQAGIEVDDVDKAVREAHKIVLEAKGRITRSELKQHTAGQFNATLHFEVAPDEAGPVRDRLKQLGNMVRLEIDRTQQAENGQKLPMDGKLERGRTQFLISIYNLANVAPRETVTQKIGSTDVPAAYRKLREAVGKAKARVLNAQLNEQDKQNVTATLDFDVRRTDEPAVQAALAAAGEVLMRKVARAAESDNVTDTKVGFRVELVDAARALARLAPRDTVTLKLASADVPAAYRKLRDALAKAEGRVVNAQLNEQDRQNATATLEFDVRRTEEPAVQAALTGAGEVLMRTVARAPESDNVTDTKVGFRVEIINATRIEPRETVTLGIEVANVDESLAVVNAQVQEAKGRVVKSQVSQARNGGMVARMIYDVPLGESTALIEKVRKAGHVRVTRVERNPQAPEGKLAIARLDVTLANDPIVPGDEGLWSQIRHGLSVSLRGLSVSVSWLIVGVLFVLPWLVLLYVAFWLLRRVWRRLAPAPVTTTAGEPATGA